MPQISDEMAINYFGELQKECFSYGLTSLHDCGITEHTLSLLEKAQSQNKLQMKIFALLEDNPNYYDRWVKKGRYTNKNITAVSYTHLDVYKRQVHDELVFEAPIEEIETAKELIKTEMESAFDTKVPLLVEVGVGDNWLEAH